MFDWPRTTIGLLGLYVGLGGMAMKGTGAMSREFFSGMRRIGTSRLAMAGYHMQQRRQLPH